MKRLQLDSRTKSRLVRIAVYIVASYGLIVSLFMNVEEGLNYYFYAFILIVLFIWQEYRNTKLPVASIKAGLERRKVDRIVLISLIIFLFAWILGHGARVLTDLPLLALGILSFVAINAMSDQADAELRSRAVQSK